MSYTLSGLLSNLGKSLSSFFHTREIRFQGHFKFSCVLIGLKVFELMALVNYLVVSVLAVVVTCEFQRPSVMPNQYES